LSNRVDSEGVYAQKVIFWKLVSILLIFVILGLFVLVSNFAKFGKDNSFKKQDIKIVNSSISQDSKYIREISELNIQLSNCQKIKTDSAPKVIIKEKIIYKKSIPNSNNLIDRLSCYDSTPGKHKLSKRCWSDIALFAKKNIDCKFELIPVIDKSDLGIIQSDDYTKAGLALLRGNEARWAIRKSIGEGAEVNLAFYNIVSKDQRGVIVRALR